MEMQFSHYIGQLPPFDPQKSKVCTPQKERSEEASFSAPLPYILL